MLAALEPAKGSRPGKENGMGAGQPCGTSAAAATTEKSTWWCNFCDFKTQDQALYLKHSCTEVLERRGKSAQGGNRTHCG